MQEQKSEWSSSQVLTFAFESRDITLELDENTAHGWEVVAKQTPKVSVQIL